MSRGSDDSFVVVLVTAPSMGVGRGIADRLVDEHLVACVNIVPGVTSIYRWQGEISEDSEVLLLCKTRRACLTQLEARVRSIHPYEVPEVIALPIVGGSQAYLDWLGAETAPGSGDPMK